MDDIWQVIAEIGSELHPERIKAASTKILSLHSAGDLPKARAAFGLGADDELIRRLQDVWSGSPHLSSAEIAAALLAASKAAELAEKRESVDMVWTGPSSSLVASRHTEQVLWEVINSARRKLFLVSFVAYDIHPVLEALQNAIGRNVAISVLLESSRSHGGKVDIDSAEAFISAVPSAAVYTWGGPSKLQGQWTGAVHAKCAVADGDLAFITSANLTAAAMERNMELGVLVRGGYLPSQLHRHLEALVETGVIGPISVS